MVAFGALIASWLFTVLAVAHGASFQSIRLDQLDNYSLLNIFDLLEFGDLANLAMMNERFEQLILVHKLIPDYGSKGGKFYIDLKPNDVISGVSYAPAANVKRTQLSQGHESVFFILSIFCPYIDALTLDIVYEKGKAGDALLDKLVDIVGKHCAHVPYDVRFEGRATPNVTFENVTSVAMRHDPNRYARIEVDKLFPRLEEMSVDGAVLIDMHLPYLQHLEYDELYDVYFDFAKFAAHNQHLSSIKMVYEWKDFDNLELLSSLFPNLETLDVGLVRCHIEPIWTSRRPGMEPIRFPSVKHYKLDVSVFSGLVEHFDDTFHQQLSLIELDQLKSLTFTQGGQLIHGMIDFIVQYRELTSLNFKKTSLRHLQMQRFIDELPELREMSFDCRVGNQFADVRRIMNEANDLQRINILVDEDGQRPEFLAILQSTNGWSKSSEFVNSFESVRSVTFDRS